MGLQSPSSCPLCCCRNPLQQESPAAPIAVVTLHGGLGSVGWMVTFSAALHKPRALCYLVPHGDSSPGCDCALVPGRLWLFLQLLSSASSRKEQGESPLECPGDARGACVAPSLCQRWEGVRWAGVQWGGCAMGGCVAGGCVMDGCAVGGYAMGGCAMGRCAAEVLPKSSSSPVPT